MTSHVIYINLHKFAKIAPFCGEIVVRGRYGSIVSTVLIGREQSRDLRRHTSSFAYHVTSLCRLPCCFAAMLFCDDTVTRGPTGQGQISRRYWLIESSHVTYEVTAAALLSKMRRFWGTVLR